MKKILLFFLFSFSILGTSWAQQDKVFGLLFETTDNPRMHTSSYYYKQGNAHYINSFEFNEVTGTPTTYYKYARLEDLDSIRVHYTRRTTPPPNETVVYGNAFLYAEAPNVPDFIWDNDDYQGPIENLTQTITEQLDSGGSLTERIYLLHLWSSVNNICEKDTIRLMHGWDWQYKIDNNSNYDSNWHTLDTLSGRRFLQIRPIDIFPNGISSGQLHFRTGYNGEWLENNIVIFDIVPCAPGLDSVDVIKPSCYNGNDGEFVLHLDRTPNPGEVFHIQGNRDGLGFAYSSTSSNVIWNGNTVTINNLYAGSYTDIQYYVKVNISTSDPVNVQDITLTDPALVTFDGTSTNVVCNGDSNGTIIIDNASGGVGSYEYSLDGTNWNSFSGNSTTINGLAARTYDVSVRDANQCVSSISVMISEPSSPISLTLDTTISEEPSANGSSDGNLTVAVSGGWGGWDINSFTWNPTPTGAITSFNANGDKITISDIPAGTYTLTATDSGGCQKIETFTLSEPPALMIQSLSIIPISCNSNNVGTCSTCNQDGQIAVTPTGGVPFNSVNNNIDDMYEYQWQQFISNNWVTITGQTNHVINNLSAGVYRVTITDANNISFTNQNDFILEEPIELSLNISKTDVTCNGGNDGTASLTASGGTEDYQYQIDNGSWTNFTNRNTTEITGLSAGSYTIMVRDSHNCEVQDSIEIQQPTAINIQFNNVVAPSPNQANGSVKALITGGTPLLNNGNLSTTSYTCVWHDDNNQIITSNNEIINGEFFTGISNVPEGNYRVEITDNNSCPSVNTIALNAINVSLSILDPIACYGGTGTIEANASGGNGNYSYEWYKDNVLISGLSSATASGLSYGTYKVELTDSSGATASDTITLSEPSLLELNSLNTQNVSCNGGSDGEAEIIVNGGTDPYNFEWSENNNGNWEVISNIGNTNTATNLHAGDYRVVVTDSHNCVLQDNGNDFVQFNIAQPQDSLQINLVEAVPASVFGANDASISFTVQGGTPEQGGTAPYEVTCQNANTDNFPITLNSGIYHVNNIPNGSYTIDVEDANLCTDSIDVVIDFEASLIVQDTIYCNGGLGTLSAIVSGGSGTYNNYQWYEIVNGQGNLISNQNSTTLQTSAGRYKVCVSDGDNHRVCSLPKQLLQPQAIDTTQVNITDVSCFDGTNGSIHIEVSGGYSGQYEYQWDGPNGYTANTQDISDLEAGNYSVEIKDAQHTSCTVLINNLVVSQPAEISINNEVITPVNHIGQAEGAIDFDVSGGTPGTPPYTYSWNGPNLNNANLTPPLDNLEVGTYDVTIVDANNCSYTHPFTITQPEVINFEINYSDVLCNGDTTVVSLQNITGGRLINNEDYTGKWYDDTNSLIGSGLTRNLPAGNYLVEVLDSYQNTTTQSFIISQPTPIDIQFSNMVTPSPGQTNGSVKALISGGTPLLDTNGNLTPSSYTCTWYDANNIVVASNNEIISNVFFTGIATVGTGDYRVEILDNNGCMANDTIHLGEINVSLSIRNPIACHGGTGTIEATAYGGNGTYSYEWYLGSVDPNNLIGTSVEMSGLYTGTYIVVLTDSSGATASDTITLSEPSLLRLINLTTQNVSCNGGSDGEAEIIVTGGTGSYNFEWSENNNGNWEVISNIGNTNTATNLHAGDYRVVVTDSQNCILQDNGNDFVQFNIAQPQDSLQIILVEAVPASVFGASDASISFTVQGGTPEQGGTAPYEVTCQNANTDNFPITLNSGIYHVNNIPNGSYTIDVEDANLCTDSIDVVIDFEASLIVQDTIYCNGGLGTLSAIVSGGSGTYDNYQWYEIVNGQGNLISNQNSTTLQASAGTYKVCVSDDNHRVCSLPYDLQEPQAITTQVNITDVSCYGGADGSIHIEVSGGYSGQYEYQWDGPNGYTANTQDISNLEAGNYSVEIKDAQHTSCTVLINNLVVSQPAEISINNEVITPVNHIGQAEGAIDFDVSGGTPGTPPYTYSWTDNNGNSGIDLDNLFAGTYDVTIVDANNCSYTHPFTITQPDVISFDINYSDVLCNGGTTEVRLQNITGGSLINNEDYTGKWYDDTNSLIGTGLTRTLPAGNYHVEVLDSYQNTTTQSFIISQPTPINIQFNNVVAPSPNQANGSVKALISGGTPLLDTNGNLTPSSYTCTWYDANNIVVVSNNEIINNVFYTGIVNIGIGDYRVEILDNNVCMANDTIHLGEINVLLSITQEIACHGGTGTIKADASGGDEDYIYEWYLGSVDPNNLIGTSLEMTMSGLSAGTYVVVLKDNSGATATDTIILSEPDLLQLINLTTQNVSCNGGSDGEAEIIVNGGTASYNFEWSENNNGNWEVISNIGNTNTATNLHAGDYRVVVTDSQNCILQDNGNDFVQFNIAQPQDSLQINLVEAVPASVFGASDASISFTVQGGTTGYTVTCKDGNNINHTVTNSNNQYYVNNIQNGSYTIDVEDANLCTDSIDVVIDFEASLIVQDTIYCNGGLGTLSAIVSGGSGTYNSYQWYEIDNGQENLISNQNSTTLQASAGTYKVCVSDDNHRVCSLPYDLQEPQAITTQVNITDVSCYGGADGSIHIEVSGGYSGQYVYDWSGPNFTANSQNISGLEAGNYSVIIKDAQHPSCLLLIDNLVVSQPASALSISNSAVTNVNHIGQAEGAIYFNVAGGTPPYIYTWNGPNLNNANLTPPLDNLEVGTYNVTIVDHNNCSIDEQFIITQPDEISYNIDYSDIHCNGGTTEVSLHNITGGRLINNEYYTCKWYNNINYLLGVGISHTLSAGSYKVEVLDSYQNSTTQSFTISEPDAISATYTVQNVSCYGEADGSINLSVSGGTPFSTGNSYTYSWTDNHGNSGVGLDNLYAGIYDVSIFDANHCSLLVQHIVIGQPTQISIDINDPNLDIISPSAGQQDGLIRVNVSGGHSGYTYQWYVWNQTNSTYDIITGATTNELSNIGEGTYQVEVTDNQNCTNSATYNLGALQPMSVTVNQTSDIDCFGGNGASLEATAGGGAGGYQYVWYDANNQVISSVSSQTISGLPAGEYYVEVSDLRGNTITGDPFVVSQPDEIEAQAQTIFSGCGNANDWNIVLDIQGGTPPYTFEWNTGDTTQNLSQVPAGNYLVVITDNNGCQRLYPVYISQPNALQITESIQQPTCHDACDGNISLNITGGTPPYDVQWDNGSNGQNIQNLCSGTYVATITDATNCVIDLSYNLLNPDNIPLDLGSDIVTCGNNPVSFDISIADPNVIYQWTGSNGFSSNSPTVQLFDEGDYTATITNSSGCTATDQIHISNIANTYHTDFLVATQVYENEEVVIVNTSNPISQNTTWIVPSSVQIVSETNERITLKFPLTGFYDISLRSSYANGCYQDYTKTIIVDEQSDLPNNGNTATPFILDFLVYPNPTSGDFTATVHLQSQATVSLKLFSLVTNILIDTRTLNILDVNENYQLQLPHGIYVLLLETPQGSEIRKIIVQ